MIIPQDEAKKVIPGMFVGFQEKTKRRRISDINKIERIWPIGHRLQSKAFYAFSVWQIVLDRYLREYDTPRGVVRVRSRDIYHLAIMRRLQDENEGLFFNAARFYTLNKPYTKRNYLRRLEFYGWVEKAEIFTTGKDGRRLAKDKFRVSASGLSLLRSIMDEIDRCHDDISTNPDVGTIASVMGDLYVERQ